GSAAESVLLPTRTSPQAQGISPFPSTSPHARAAAKRGAETARSAAPPRKQARGLMTTTPMSNRHARHSQTGQGPAGPVDQRRRVLLWEGAWRAEMQACAGPQDPLIRSDRRRRAKVIAQPTRGSSANAMTASSG